MAVERAACYCTQVLHSKLELDLFEADETTGARLPADRMLPYAVVGAQYARPSSRTRRSSSMKAARGSPWVGRRLRRTQPGAHVSVIREGLLLKPGGVPQTLH